MAGSNKIFPYRTDSGVLIHVRLDESTTEAINQNITGFVAGSPIYPVRGKLRQALYRSTDGLTSVPAVVLTLAGLATLPASFDHETVLPDGTADTVEVFLSSTRGEKFSRAIPVDTGKIDGDQP